MKLKLHAALSEIPRNQWEELQCQNFPFSHYDFLSALETSGCVGPDTGWVPLYLTAWDRQDLLGALYLYVKSDSYGEFIFDWEWARAYRSHGIPYYPKLVSAVPFTPATGPKILLHARADREKVAAALIEGTLQLRERMKCSSVHALFIAPEETGWFEAAGFLIRETFQYHWKNADYTSFDDFLRALKSRRRKQIVHEREEIRAQGITIEVLSGPSLTREHAAIFHRFYLSTIEKWGSLPYLNLTFLETVFETMRDQVVCLLAWQDGKCVAGTLNFRQGKSLFGRYWGADTEVRYLHFELCYYRLIEYAIAEGITLFEAGAQGEHKVSRGFLPERTRSAHFVAHPEFRGAIALSLEREKLWLQDQLTGFRAHSPYRTD